MLRVREAQVAGFFYPAGREELERTVKTFLLAADDEGPAPKALIVPHSAYAYSGPVAASAYALVRGPIRRVVLLGTAHRYQGPGLAAHSADCFATPLGNVPLDHEAIASLRGLPQVRVLDDAHEGEHSLEVHLPFLQLLLRKFKIVPLVVGEATPAEVAQVLERLWGGPETIVVVSSDLSHYHDYETAKRLDEGTAAAIEEKVGGIVGPRQACGCRAIAGLLEVAKRLKLHVKAVDLRNSGDIAGGRDEVVGFGAFTVNG
jgi:AmmeMemoRadiSam system protein B